VPEQEKFSRLQLRRLVLFGLSGTILGLLIALTYIATAPHVYEATAFANVDRVAPAAKVGIYPRIDAIAVLANSTSTFDSVADELDLDETEAELRSKVVVRPLFGNLALRVTVTDGSAEHAADIARGFVAAIADFPVPDNSGEGADYRVGLRLPSIVPSTPATPKPSHDLPAGGFLGLAAGVIASTIFGRSTPRKTTGGSHAE
jgi:succinoglycan biosynthesis transport protein ExoP